MPSNPVASGNTNNNTNSAQYQSGTQQQNSNTNMTGSSTTNSAQQTADNFYQAQNNDYSSAQDQLQVKLLNSLSGYIQNGTIPQGLVDPSQVTNAYQSNFNQSVAPQIAAEYGAGSPQIASNENLGMVQLLSNLWQQGNSDYLGGIGASTTAAFTPRGVTTQGSGLSNTVGTSQTDTSQNQNSSTSGSWQDNNTAAGAALAAGSAIGSAATTHQVGI